MKLFCKKKTQQEGATEIPEESKKRRTLTKQWNIVVSIVAICSTLFHIAGLTVWPMDPFLFRAVSLLSMAMLCFFLVPARKNSNWSRPTFYDLILVAMCVSVIVYLALNYTEIYYRAGFQPTALDEVFALFTLFLVIAMTRRLIGWSLPIIAFIFLAYAVLGAHLPGILGHRGYTFQRAVMRARIHHGPAHERRQDNGQNDGGNFPADGGEDKIQPQPDDRLHHEQYQTGKDKKAHKNPANEISACFMRRQKSPYFLF